MHVRPLLAEFVGTAALVATIVGSGIAASRLSPDDAGLQLLMNAAATAAALYVIITVFGPISGAHLNPVVSIGDAVLGHRPWRDVLAYIPVQIGGAITGAAIANVMFGVETTISAQLRLTWTIALAEVIATAGLVNVIFILARTGRSHRVAPAVALFVGAAYFATSSTSFANPAVTIGRVFTNTFAGIDPTSALGFVAAQIVGGAIGLVASVALATRPTHPQEQPNAAL